MPVSLFVFRRQVHWCLILDPTYPWYHQCLSLTFWLPSLGWSLLAASLLLQMALFHSFHDWVILLCAYLLYVPHLLYSFVRGWVCSLLRCLGYCQQCCHEDETKVKVAQSCPDLCDPMYYTVHGILQAGTLEWVAFLFSRGSSQPRNWTQASRITGGFFTSWTTREAQEYCSG